MGTINSLLEAGANTKHINLKGNNVLSEYISSVYLNEISNIVIERLVKNGADINIINNNGHSPLSLAVWKTGIVSRLELVKKLIALGANINHVF